MSCYFRHLKSLFDEAGIQVTAANRKELDRTFHRLVGADYKDCPAAWRNLKQELATDEKRQAFIAKLKAAGQERA